MDIVDKVREIARNAFSGSRGSHDWEHTERVYSLSLTIAEKEGADLQVVKIGALLHDIARKEEDESEGNISHAELGAKVARSILLDLGLDSETIDAIARCIETHRWRSGKPPVSIEAKVLFDADKLDSIGAVGVGRAFLFAGEVGAKLHNPGADIASTSPYTSEDTAYREFMVKLRFIKDRMLTKEGRRLAMERHEYMAGFFERLDREIEGSL